MLDASEFESLLKALFSFNGNAYSIPKARINSMLTYFDSKKVKFDCIKSLSGMILFLINLFGSKQGKLTLQDFESFWFKIVKAVLFFV